MPNPLCKNEAQEIDDLFQYALTTRNRLCAQEQKKIYTKVVAQCGENNESAIRAHGEVAMEDSVVERRGLMKPNICMSTAVLVTKLNEARQYF